MGRPKKKKAAPQVDVPIAPAAPAPAPPPPPIPQQPPKVAVAAPAIEGEPGNALRNGNNPVAQAEPIAMVTNPEGLLNNVLCREINDPSAAGSEASDPNLTILEELARGLTAGTDLNHVREDVLRIASNQPEKVNVIKSMLLAIDLNRAARFAKVRDKAEAELARAALRGDLKSTEYLAFLKFSTTELAEIQGRLNPHDIMQASGTTDSQAMLDRMDHTKQEQEKAQAEQFKGTTPQGMEIIRKQVFKIKKRLRKAGKLKSKDDSKLPPGPKKK
jgi:hypothetical protein